jgi:hypothetical protein
MGHHQKAAELSGYSEKAIRNRIAKGVWLQGDIWIKAPDGRILISIEGIERWAEGQLPLPQRQYRSRPNSGTRLANPKGQ